MLFHVLNRGYKTANDLGINKSYFLYLKVWYRLISSYDFRDTLQSAVMVVGTEGHVANHYVYTSGGVRIFKVML